MILTENEKNAAMSIALIIVLATMLFLAAIVTGY